MSYNEHLPYELCSLVLKTVRKEHNNIQRHQNDTRCQFNVSQLMPMGYSAHFMSIDIWKKEQRVTVTIENRTVLDAGKDNPFMKKLIYLCDSRITRMTQEQEKAAMVLRRMLSESKPCLGF